MWPAAGDTCMRCTTIRFRRTATGSLSAFLDNAPTYLVFGQTALSWVGGQLTDAGITGAFVVGGDAQPAGEFFDALAVLQAMDEIGHNLTVGITAYPEGHHVVPDEVMQQALVDKERHAAYMTTQMCFTPATIADWISTQRRQGIGLPISIGIPGVAELRRGGNAASD